MWMRDFFLHLGIIIHQNQPTMKQLGGFLVLIGLAAIVLNFMNFVPKILFWIYQWGEGTAWAIKIGLVVVGALLYIVGSRRESSNT